MCLYDLASVNDLDVEQRHPIGRDVHARGLDAPTLGVAVVDALAEKAGPMGARAALWAADCATSSVGRIEGRLGAA